jgi:hypothetical protein
MRSDGLELSRRANADRQECDVFRFCFQAKHFSSSDKLNVSFLPNRIALSVRVKQSPVYVLAMAEMALFPL